MRKLLALIAVLSLSGCAVQEPAPEVTPVDLKYCAVSDSAGFNDDGLNRSVYAAMQQLKIQTGASVVAIEVSGKLGPSAAITKLIEADCNAIVTSGTQLITPTIAAAKKNSTIRFYSVSDSLVPGVSSANFSALTFNIFQAAYAAGYLAAAASEGEVSIINKSFSKVTNKAVEAFTAGIERFNDKNQEKVSLNLSNTYNSQSTIFAVSGNSTLLPELNGARVIGFGRDWYGDVRNKEIRNTILTSIIRVDAIGKVVDAVINQRASQHFDFANGGVGLIDAQEVAWPSGFTAEESEIVRDFQDGKVKVD